MNRSIEFFDRQFERQVDAASIGLNPFEQAALPQVRGKVLDFGCGMGELSLAAARAGCTVHALDASEVAVARLRRIAEAEGLPIHAEVADLRTHRLEEHYDTVVSIGLLMFFDCATAERLLSDLESHLQPGGTLIVNVLVEGTTYMDIFDPQGYCLFERDALTRRYSQWSLISSTWNDFAAPGGLNKAFATVVARKPMAS